MSISYWAQFSDSELLSMHGIDIDDCHDDDHVFQDDCEEINEVNSCPKCSGCGCNYCLMTIW